MVWCLTLAIVWKYSELPEVVFVRVLTFLAQGVTPSCSPAMKTFATWLAFTVFVLPW